MIKEDFSIKLAGPAGMGIKSGGQLFSKFFQSLGFYFHDYTEYPSLVRGGHNTYQATYGYQKVHAPHQKIDYFFSLKPGHCRQHQNEFHPNTLVFSDKKNPVSKGKFINLPLSQLSSQAGNPLSANIICFGIIAFLLNQDKSQATSLISKVFSKNTKTNLIAFDIGYIYAQQNLKQYQQTLKIPKQANQAKAQSSAGGRLTSFNDGNQAFAYGFLQGKGNFYAAYPMTPSSGTLHFLASRAKDYNITVVHPEDEIATASLAVGAAFAGARSAVGTSGGGFALMNETVSFCGMSEIGMLYYLVSRPGPATGMPTWTSQSDLLYAIFSGHGEFPKVVIAPGDQQESFDFANIGLNLADQLQTPIIVLSDKFIAESSASTTDLSKEKVIVNRGKILNSVTKNFKRYNWITRSGVSPRCLPGTTNGQFLANSSEHNQFGFSSDDSIVAVKMQQKRAKKLKTAKILAPKPRLFGNKQADSLIISWGSNKGIILEALKKLDNFAFLQIRTLWPLHDSIKKTIKKYKKTIIIENSQTSRLGFLLKSLFSFSPTATILKFNGRPFFPEELIKKFKK
ncbi:2-oxoacid:acceptor oxidoreductase subunit alpha [Patescibacteria group bacterium]|nr:2-oxoacid:acceptor oxidoreductase subunit alpha [Patescibacteria group bacterium]